jgi:hypothetical protein
MMVIASSIHHLAEHTADCPLRIILKLYVVSSSSSAVSSV